MAQRNNRTRRILLILIILLLGSISYLALEASIYYEGQWQAVQGSGIRPGSQNPQEFQVTLPMKKSYAENHWDVIREGRLFFEPEPVVQPPEYIKPNLPIQQPVFPSKPTCPWILLGVLYSSDSSAILANRLNKESQVVWVGTKLGEFEVVEIEKDYVLVESPEAEFKLELGGK